ncbi:hypothetical protein [Rhizobium sp. 007]|uniref:hypothetical protein n=1 Tax=Rhizobium sp. 007 TaxID=2785056 RepID=UPI00188F4250|nr:hypothetical protein [Rhizobium sp. 007]QPB18725.1 hypothetical protein ISN39_13810 [Rhizobium sp. 007]
MARRFVMMRYRPPLKVEAIADAKIKTEIDARVLAQIANRERPAKEYPDAGLKSLFHRSSERIN